MGSVGYLLPGIFSQPHGARWNNRSARDRAARSVVIALKGKPKTDQGSALCTMQILDWYTQHGRPLPKRALVALAAALGIRKRQRLQHQADMARKLHAEGLERLEIAERLGLPCHKPKSAKQQVRRLCNEIAGAPDYGWTDPDEVIAAVRAITNRKWGVEAKQCLYDAAAWCARRSQPLPYSLWWAAARALRLAHADRLTQDTITVITDGVLRVDAFKAATHALGRERAKHPRAKINHALLAVANFYNTQLVPNVEGFEPLSEQERKKIIADAYPKGRRFGDVKPMTADALAKVADNEDGWGGNPECCDDIIREWSKRPDWQLSVLGAEVSARNKARWPEGQPDQLRLRAIELVVEARMAFPPDSKLEGLTGDDAVKILLDDALARRALDSRFSGCAPYSVADLADKLHVHESTVESLMRDPLRWDFDVARKEVRLRG